MSLNQNAKDLLKEIALAGYAEATFKIRNIYNDYERAEKAMQTIKKMQEAM